MPKLRNTRALAVHASGLCLIVPGVLVASVARADGTDPTDPGPLPQLPPPSAAPAAPPPPPPSAIEPAQPLAAPTPSPNPACPTPCEEKKKHPPSPGSGVVGVRTQFTQAKAPSGNADAIGVTFAGRLETHNDDKSYVASRLGLDFALGGGTGDVEGLFGGALLVGARAPIDVHHAPFLRVGLAGEYQGNSRYLYSRFDLPLGEAGYQFVSQGTLFEIGARVSPVLTGRFRAGADTRELTSAFSAGGFLTARGDAGRIDILYTRVRGSDGQSRSLDTFQGIGCLVPIGSFAICLDGQILSTSYAGFGTAEGEHFVATIGGLVGFGMAGIQK